MPRGAGIFRRIFAGVLALVLLALPGPAVRHASAATLVQQAVTDHCAAYGDGATLAHAAASAHGHGQPCDQPADEPGLACCVTAQCVAGFEAPLPTLVGPLPSPGAVVRYTATARGTLGLKVPPSLPPPRHAA
jgi:hypothetical protein